MTDATPAGPNPDLGLAEVVALLIGSLANADPTDPVAAAESLHRFASPAMRGRVGGRDELESALLSPLYRPLLGHVAVAAEPLERLDDAARQRLTVTGRDGTVARYLLALARRDGGSCSGCWLLSGLARDDL